MGFIKSGNLSMVAGLIDFYDLGMGVLSLRHDGDPFKYDEET